MNSPFSSPAAVLWDHDGTLLDTEPIWIEVEIALLAEYGTVWTREQGLELIGRSWLDASTALIDAIGDYSIDPYEFYLRRIDAVAARVRESEELPWRPGAEALLRELSELGMPMGLVSASAQKLLDVGLERMGHPFDIVVTGDDVEHGKPHPEGYLKAASALGVDPRDCIVIEDSVAGTAAGRASGALVVAVPDLNPLEDEHPRQIVVDSLVGKDVAWLRRVCEAEGGNR